MLRPEEVKISFFKIDRCGFYSYGTSQASFGSIEDTLTQLQQWSSGSDLALTRIADPTGRADENPVYLFGIRKLGASWILATWNEIPSHESGVPSVSMNAKVGETAVHMNDIEEDSIPGFATYFWIVPERNVLATIRFKNGRSGQGDMVSYIGRFMSRFTSYTILSRRNNEQIVVGYTDRDDEIDRKVRPVFRTHAFQKPNRSQFLFQNVDRIRRVVRRGHMSTTTSSERDLWQSLIRFVRSSQEGNHVVRKRIYVELDYSPNLAELQAMIAAEETDPDVTGWDDMGFVLEGESNPHWLGKEHATGDFMLNVARINEEAVDLQSILQALSDNRDSILQLLQ